MPIRLFVDEQDGQVAVRLQRDRVVAPEPASKNLIPFACPLTAGELEDLRWYLEEYLPAPFGVWGERGPRIDGSLAGWGQRLFGELFGPGRPGRDAYLAAREAGDFELWVSSDSPAFLGLPWELLADPDLPDPLAVGRAQINRTIPRAVIDPAEVRRGEALRVLMVISRPGGRRDVPYQMIARPLLERLGAVSGKVVLEVLRPPTVEALTHRLEEAKAAGEPFDVLHFDGHGVFGRPLAEGGGGDDPLGRREPYDPRRYAAPEGFLVFEGKMGGDDPISAGDFASLLAKADIPLLVLNACQSAMVAGGAGPEAAVATRLLQQGAAAVVAMGYSVYAVAAAEFMAVFYEAIFAGGTAAEAVAAGRRQLKRRNLRPSPVGPMPLADWLVPVHYARSDVRFPQLGQAHPRAAERLARTLDELRERARSHPAGGAEGATEAQADPLAAVGQFFGRDEQFYELETALRTRHVVVVHGVGGTGKTELAKAFARWLAASGGLDNGRAVLVHSFEPGLATFGLDGAVTAAGLGLFGPEFVREFPTPEARRAVLLEVLRRHRVLLLWDNFETVRSMPDPTGATPPLGEAQWRAMADFLRAAAGADARGGVILTSRSAEEWLGDDDEVCRLELSGLNAQEAAEYADWLLAPFPDARPRRQAPAYGELVELLAGHPLSMRLILPHLARTDARMLVDGLKGVGELPPGFEGGAGKLESLGACVQYSIRHLSEEDRRRLPALCLFEGVVDANTLGLLSSKQTAPERFRGATMEAWKETLGRCAKAGLLSQVGTPIYRMHPALPGYLATLWRQEAGDGFGAEYDAAILAAIRAHAALGAWLDKQIGSGSDETAMAVLSLERRTLGAMAGRALERRMYTEAQGILQPLDEFWKARGLVAEAAGWAERCRAVTEDPSGNPPDLDTAAGGVSKVCPVSAVLTPHPHRTLDRKYLL